MERRASGRVGPRLIVKQRLKLPLLLHVNFEQLHVPHLQSPLGHLQLGLTSFDPPPALLHSNHLALSVSLNVSRKDHKSAVLKK
jgi:hypothetical protein